MKRMHIFLTNLLMSQKHTVLVGVPHCQKNIHLKIYVRSFDMKEVHLFLEYYQQIVFFDNNF